MSAPDTLTAARAETGLDVELGDDRDDRGQIGLVLKDDARINQRDVAIRAHAARDVDDAVNLGGSRCRAKTGRMALAPARSLLAFFVLFAAEGIGLAVRLAACLIQLRTKLAVFLFEFANPALQTCVVFVEFVELLLQASEFTIPCAAARTFSSKGEHGKTSTTR